MSTRFGGKILATGASVNWDITVEIDAEGNITLRPAGGGGGGGLPGDNTITIPMLAFDPATQAELNAALASALNRANHTGTQAQSTIVNLPADLAQIVADVAAKETPSGAQTKANAAQAAAIAAATVAAASDATTKANAAQAAAIAAAAADATTKANAKVAEAIADGVTTVAPSQNVVFDALATKAPLANPTFTGNVVIPAADADNEALNRATADARYPVILEYTGSAWPARPATATNAHHSSALHPLAPAPDHAALEDGDTWLRRGGDNTLTYYVKEGTLWVGGGVTLPVNSTFTLGTTKPNASNTGLIAPTTSIISTADVTYSTPNQVIENVLFLGNVRVTATNVRFYNCEFLGKNSTTSNHIVRANDVAQAGVVFERCKFSSRYLPDTDGSLGAHGGVMGHNMTFIRCDFSGACDGIGIVGSNVLVQGCYFHDFWFTSPNADHLTDGNHCDGIQGHGMSMSNITIDGCTIEGLVDDSLPNSQAQFPPVYSGANLISGNSWYDDFPHWSAYTDFDYPPWATSAVLFGYSGTPTLSNLTITRNWLDGGGYAAINLSPSWVNGNATNIVVTNNRLGAHQRDGYLLICKNTLTVTLTGNTYEADGTAANTRRNG